MNKNLIFMVILIFVLFSLAINADADDLFLTGPLASGIYEGDNIITQNDCIIAAGTDVNFVTRNKIILNQGFRVESGGSFFTTLDDNDILPDQWELTYFRTLGFEPNDDPDSDGVTNYLEYRIDTNPNDTNNKPDPGYFYEYDESDRLKSVIYLSENYSNNYEIQYEYDSSGNRTKKIVQMQ